MDRCLSSDLLHGAHPFSTRGVTVNLKVLSGFLSISTVAYTSLRRLVITYYVLLNFMLSIYLDLDMYLFVDLHIYGFIYI